MEFEVNDIFINNNILKKILTSQTKLNCRIELKYIGQFIVNMRSAWKNIDKYTYISDFPTKKKNLKRRIEKYQMWLAVIHHSSVLFGAVQFLIFCFERS